MGAARANTGTRKGRFVRAVCLALAVPLSLSACATRAGFQARMHSFVGASEADLVAALGVPTGVHEAGGRRFLEFEDRRLVAIPATVGWWGPGWGGFPPTVETRSCATTFALRGGRVESFTFRGNACAATMPA